MPQQQQQQHTRDSKQQIITQMLTPSLTTINDTQHCQIENKTFPLISVGPSHQSTFCGSTGRPRTGDQDSANEEYKKSGRDPKRASHTPRTRNIGIRNTNTIQIRREEVTNKRRVATRMESRRGSGEKEANTQSIPKSKAEG